MGTLEKSVRENRKRSVREIETKPLQLATLGENHQQEEGIFSQMERRYVLCLTKLVQGLRVSNDDSLALRPRLWFLTSDSGLLLLFVLKYKTSSFTYKRLGFKSRMKCPALKKKHSSNTTCGDRQCDGFRAHQSNTWRNSVLKIGLSGSATGINKYSSTFVDFKTIHDVFVTCLWDSVNERDPCHLSYFERVCGQTSKSRDPWRAFKRAFSHFPQISRDADDT